jgi:outer membrane murein-binding lipoprotein Lpp
LPKNVAELRLYLSKVKPWVGVAVLCSLVLAGFYTIQGMKYWQAWEESRTMASETQQIALKLDNEAPRLQQVAADLEAQQQKLAELQVLFDYPDVGELMGIVSTTAWETQVDLPSIAAGDPGVEAIDGMQYRTQALTFTLQGDTEAIYRFLSRLYEKVPVVSVTNLSIANPGADATAQVQLVFYLSPDLTSTNEGAD